MIKEKQDAAEICLGQETQALNIRPVKSVLWFDESKFEIFASSGTGTLHKVKEIMTKKNYLQSI